jgi:hypothetical protein
MDWIWSGQSSSQDLSSSNHSHQFTILEGKITCPRCNYKLGSYNWAGTQCSCGTWVAPAFMIHKSRIDHQ